MNAVRRWGYAKQHPQRMVQYFSNFVTNKQQASKQNMAPNTLLRGFFFTYNANSRIDNICLQQTNLVCNFGRQDLSAFCTILAARASAFLKRFVKHESRQTLSRRFVCRFVCNFEGGRGEGPRHSEAAAIMQTKFACKYRQRNVYLKTRFV